MSGGHDHAIPDSGNERALWMVLGLTSIFLVTEVIAGIVFKSLALLADLAHMFTHVSDPAPSSHFFIQRMKGNIP